MYFKYVTCFLFLELKCSFPVAVAVFERISSYDFCHSYLGCITRTLLYGHEYRPVIMWKDKTLWQDNQKLFFFSTGTNHVLAITKWPSHDPFLVWGVGCSAAGWYLSCYDTFSHALSECPMSPHQMDFIICQYKRGIK